MNHLAKATLAVVQAEITRRAGVREVLAATRDQGNRELRLSLR